MKKIIVCGDSFCSSATHVVKGVGDRKHFSQILEDKYGYTVINLAHGGMSNVGIWFQIREAITLAPQVIVYNQTWSSRVELIVEEKFNIERGLKNFIYSNPHYTSTHLPHVGNKDSGSVLSTVWQGLADSPFVKVNKEQLTAIDLYLKHLYHDGLNTVTDTWMFEYWQFKIEQSGILGIKFNDERIGGPAYDYSSKNEIDCPFHTDALTQEIVAKNIHREIQSTVALQ